MVHAYDTILSSFKTEDILTHAKIRVNLEDNMLNKKKSQKCVNICFYLYEVANVYKFIETKQNGGCQGLGREEVVEYCLMDTEFQ